MRGQRRWNSGLEQRVRNEANPINRQRWEAEPTGHQGQRSVVSEGGCCRNRGGSVRGRPAQELLLPEPASAGFELSTRIIWNRNSKNLPNTSITSFLLGGECITFLLSDTNTVFSLYGVTYYLVSDIVRLNRQKCLPFGAAWETAKSAKLLGFTSQLYPVLAL